LNLLHGFNLSLIENAGGARVADSVDVSQRNINVLGARKSMPAIRAMFVLYLSQLLALSAKPRVKGQRLRLSLALFVFGGFADHPHHTLAVNDLALVANFLY
jgi:hypothetical protein